MSNNRNKRDKKNKGGYGNWNPPIYEQFAYPTMNYGPVPAAYIQEMMPAKGYGSKNRKKSQKKNKNNFFDLNKPHPPADLYKEVNNKGDKILHHYPYGCSPGAVMYTESVHIPALSFVKRTEETLHQGTISNIFSSKPGVRSAPVSGFLVELASKKKTYVRSTPLAGPYVRWNNLESHGKNDYDRAMKCIIPGMTAKFVKRDQVYYIYSTDDFMLKKNQNLETEFKTDGSRCKVLVPVDGYARTLVLKGGKEAAGILFSKGVLPDLPIGSCFSYKKDGLLLYTNGNMEVYQQALSTYTSRENSEDEDDHGSFVFPSSHFKKQV